MHPAKRPQLRKQKWLLWNSTKIAAQFLGLEQSSQKAPLLFAELRPFREAAPRLCPVWQA
jgi:hypothetical protein